MSAENPPTYNFSGIDFNNTYFSNENNTSLTKAQADNYYLNKQTPDTAPVLETFNVGLKTNSIESINSTDTLNISTASSTAVNIVNIGNDTTNNQTLNLNSKTINIGDTTVASAVNIITSATFSGNSTFNSNLIASTINSISQATALNIGGNQIASTGILNIGCSQAARLGPVNICNTLTTGTGQIINIGSNVITSGTQIINLGGQQTISGGGSQTINLNKPLTVAYTGPPSSIAQIGGIQEISATYSNLTTNSTKTICSITNLNIGVFMAFYSIKHILDTIAINYSLIRHGLTNTADSFTNIESNIYISHPGTRAYTNDLELIENNCGIITISPALQAIHLTVNCTFTTTSPGLVPLSLLGLLRVIRIG